MLRLIRKERRDISALFLLMFYFLTLSEKRNHSNTAVCLLSLTHFLVNSLVVFTNTSPPAPPQRCHVPPQCTPSCLSLTTSSYFSSLFPLSSAPAPLPDCFQSFLREEALDFFCSQCHKQISRLEDLSTRLNFLEMTR